MFPFQFGDKKYNGCLKRHDNVFILFTDKDSNNNNDLQTWCATEVDKDGIFQGNPGYWEDPWGFCGPDCPTHEETLTWRKDETAKVTLQFSNSALWVGLELYGGVLPWIFILGLILTTVLPILGKVIIKSEFPIVFPIISFQSSSLLSSRSQSSVSAWLTRWTRWTGIGNCSRTVSRALSKTVSRIV